jgi:tetrapyrrole methylase family protein/MazG family protein
MKDAKILIDELLGKESYDFYDLCDVVRVLRSDVGCPWDREQDHKSIRNDLIEETYEVIEAIDNDDFILLREELGDVMLQTVFHSTIEEETGRFDIHDVTDEICKKLIHRHPHVFGDVVAETSDKVLENWDNIKKDEKSRTTVYSQMESVPPMLPALMRARKIGSRAAKVGFDFPCAEEAFKKIEEESRELKESIGTENAHEELGDLLFSVVNVARLLGIDPEQALNDSTKKFMERFRILENHIIADGKNMKDLSIDELDFYYNDAKYSTKD